MKYIRTKDKIYEVKNYFMLPLDYPQFSVKGSDEKFYEAYVKSADTIEELCDEFVVVGSYYHKDPFLFPKEQGIPLEEIWQHFDSSTTCFGAIWTDKGLQFVARMNDEGVLELF